MNLKRVLVRISSTYRVPLSIAVPRFRSNKLQDVSLRTEATVDFTLF